MGISKAKKAIIALRERVNTVEINGDLVQKAVSEEEWKATKQCADEIKTLLEAYERQGKQINDLSKKIARQRGMLKVFQKREGHKFYFSKIESKTITEAVIDKHGNFHEPSFVITGTVTSTKSYSSHEILELQQWDTDIYLILEKRKKHESNI